MARNKYIFVIGGVMSGVGKGVATASIGTILKSKGYNVTALKCDPYINVDAGTMNPTEHGEVYVLKDGDECDQDMGNYERFIGNDLTRINYMTTGRIYQEVINKERNLEYGGRCVEVVPHIPEAIINQIKAATKKTGAEISLIEIGGTAGEYQNLLFLEAARMMKLQNPRDVVFILVSYLPIPNKIGEMKTKPTQYASRTLNSSGIQADFILCRSEYPIDDKRRQKLALLCSIDKENAVSAPDVDSIYEIPINFEEERLGEKILKKLSLKPRQKDLTEWRQFVEKSHRANKPIRIGIVGKYFETGEFILSDSYISVIESVKIAAWHQGFKPEMVWLSATDYEKDPRKLKELEQLDGIIVPGGFGSRGIEGKIAVAKYCREHQIPYFGLCYGMQIATIEFARHVCKLKGAHTEEIDPKTAHPVIHIMPDQKKKLRQKDYGGSMRLGEYACALTPGTISYKAYNQATNGQLKSQPLTTNLRKHTHLTSPILGEEPISRSLLGSSLSIRGISSSSIPVVTERHRHRYELNNDYRNQLEKAGLTIAGVNPERNLAEIVEVKNHPFMVGTQFHPEFNSRPLHPHPLFLAFIKAASVKKSSHALAAVSVKS